MRPSPKTLYLVGAGGHGRELAWLAASIWGTSVNCVFVVDQTKYLRADINGMPVKLLQDLKPAADDAFVAAVGDPHARRYLAEKCEAYGITPTVLVHPRLEVGPGIVIGDGSVICAGSVLTVDIEIGRHVHINLGCTISHDVVLGDFATLSPGVHLAGNVVLGADVFVGVGASVINGSSGEPLTIGAGAVVAAGACVTESVPAGAMVAGVPATRRR